MPRHVNMLRHGTMLRHANMLRHAKSLSPECRATLKAMVRYGSISPHEFKQRGVYALIHYQQIHHMCPRHDSSHKRLSSSASLHKSMSLKGGLVFKARRLLG